MNRLRRDIIGQAPETDEARALDLQTVAPHEGVFLAGGLHESAVRALIDEDEVVAVDLDARMQPRDEIAADDEIVVLGAADGNVGTLVIDASTRGPDSAGAGAACGRRAPPSAIAGSMLVTSSVCQSTS